VRARSASRLTHWAERGLLLVAIAASGCRHTGSPAAAPLADASLAPPDAEAKCELDLPLTADLCQQVRALAVPARLPPTAGNPVADDERAAQLGFLAFYDIHFSPLPELRCATCHLPERSFTDGKPRSESILGHPGTRNSPSLLNAAWSGPFYFWDGRADSLWSQPLFAVENPDEMGGTRLGVAHALYDNPIYKAQYEALFGALPALADSERFPAAGKPGDAAYDAMLPADRAAIDLVVANFGKAMEAYLRKLSTGRSALDDFLAGDHDALDATARQGLASFASKGCIRCHGGPALSDGKFYAMDPLTSDPGRAVGIAALHGNPFNASGPYFDADAGVRPPDVAAQPSDEHALKTPVLRNVARTAPYWHDGRYPDLSSLLSSGHGASLDADEQNAMTVFLLSLNGSYPVRPWSDWPAR
jgi:cytochrome c peroxidase